VTPDAPVLRFLTSETEDWQDVHGDGEAAFSSFLTQILTSPQLAVLCGLGTSRCIVNGDGEPLAPNMNDLWRAVKEADEDQFQRVLKIVSSPPGEEDVELLLSRCQMQQELTPNPALKVTVEDCSWAGDDQH
jgi:hypothetical protein